MTDGYSVGLLILYVMCESKELFYRLRDNYCQLDYFRDCLDDFEEEPLIKFVKDMMNRKLTVEECIERWNEISVDVEILTKNYLVRVCVVPRVLLDVQDNMHKLAIKLANASLLDK